MSNLIPLGHYVLVEDAPIEQKSAGGILIMSDQEKGKEEEGQEFGRVIAFGPIAFKDVKGCNGPEDWGVDVGDLVEYSARYEGKKSAFMRTGMSSDTQIVSRLIPDTSIVSKFVE